MRLVPLVGKCVYQGVRTRRAHRSETLVASVLRVYAINGRRFLFPALVLFFSLVLPIATNVVGNLSETRTQIGSRKSQYNATSLVRMTLPGSDSCGYYTTTPVRTREL